MTETNRAAALFDGQQSEEAVIARLTSTEDVDCAESRAADIVVERVVQRRFRWNPGLGWLEWDGSRWDTDPVIEPRLIEAVRCYIDTTERDRRALATDAAPARRALMARVAARVPDAQRTNNRRRVLTDDELFKAHAIEAEKEEMLVLADPATQAEMWLNLLSAGKINAVIKLCRTRPGVLTRTSELDSHRDLVNCANGVFDPRTGQLRPPDPDLLFTHVTEGGYDPSVESKLLHQALEAIPPKLREWYQLRLGQAASGHCPDDDSLILEHGEGENGKTAVKLAALRALGSYARPISHRVLSAPADAHPTELMELRGLRLAVLEETPEEGRLDPHRIKMTIGTGHITARLMRKDSVTFETSHTLHITSNYWPQVDTTDHGTWRKLKGMIWPYKYLPPGQEPTRDHERVGDRTIKARIRTDSDIPTAMLTWILDGTRKWYANGQVLPEDPPLIKEATEEWRKSCDVGYQFAVDYLTGDPSCYISGAVMKYELDAFLVSQGKKKWSSQLINNRLGSSMLAAGITTESTPRTPVDVGSRKESYPGDPLGKETAAGRGSTVKRVWQGVRFQGHGGHLRAVPDPAGVAEA